MSPRLFTHSSASCFRSCPRKYWIKQERGIRRAEESLALRVGSAFHEAQDFNARGLDPLSAIFSSLPDPYDVALVTAMYEAHRRRYAGQEIELVASELEFRIPLINPETWRPTPNWLLAGKIDKIGRLGDGRLCIMERKTTARDFSPGAEYWAKVHMDQQPSIYVIAARELGYDVSAILYDVTKRPLQRPAKATPLDKQKHKADGTLYANQRAVDETPEEFGARVAAVIAADPDKYFARIDIARLDKDLDECRAELWQQQLAIRACQRTGHWYRNPNSCFGNYQCEYLPICYNYDLAETVPVGYIQSDNVHPELGGE